ncbi:MAG: hypothetical protein J07HN6_00207 [Halonotius sp. J07HN6]|nr:MAG: hypothetical protein J07HN6_00207 [Halonotius sp. J07HN6]
MGFASYDKLLFAIDKLDPVRITSRSLSVSNATVVGEEQ